MSSIEDEGPETRWMLVTNLNISSLRYSPPPLEIRSKRRYWSYRNLLFWIKVRMTIAQLIECVLGKTCSLNGYNADATPFSGVDVEQISDVLEQTGFERYGTETLYNGRTGEQLKAKIFIGPTFYYRLKHLVSDKIHSRSSGPYQLLTKQPAEGRSRAGNQSCQKSVFKISIVLITEGDTIKFRGSLKNFYYSIIIVILL